MGDDHDAVLRVFDATERLDKKIVGWKWADGRPTISPTAHEESKVLIDEANERTDVEEHEHGDVLARLWVDEDESVVRTDWQV